MTPISLPPSSLSLRVAIIGGGISGLAAAHRLNELVSEVEIELFEASDRLGGVLNTVKRGGFLVEQSADNFLVKPPAALELCRQVGLADDMLTTDESRRRAFVVRRGKLVPIPDGFYLMSPRKLWPILTSSVLSLRGKFRLLAEPFISRRPQTAETDESVAAFARRRLGNEVFERLVQPLVAGIYTADPEQLSMAATLPQFLEFERTKGSLLRATLRRRQIALAPSENTFGPHNSNAASGARYGLFVAPKAGMTSFVTAIADRLLRTKVRLQASVASLSLSDGRWQVRTNSANAADLGTTTYDAVIVALPSHAAAKILDSVDIKLADALEAIEYAGCAVVSLGFARSQIGHPLDGFGFVVPETERRRVIAGSFASLKYPGRAPDHDVLIRVFIGGALQPEMLKLSDDDLVRVAREELSELLNVVGRPVASDVARWPRSMPQYHVGHLVRVARVQKLADLHPTLALAGNAYRGVGIPQCVASGEAAAARIAEHLSRKAIA
jgi:oxygen-dependent protoporphyrinogen oxidase